jgi:S-adenosylmethionine-dependent methyltransferase
MQRTLSLRHPKMPKAAPFPSIGGGILARKAALLYAQYLESPEGSFRAERFWNLLEVHLRSRPASPEALYALDAGGGTGELSARLAERGFEVTLLDPSAAMLALARRRKIPNTTLVRGTFAHLAQLRQRFDVIACHLSLEYAPDPHTALGDVVTALSPRGLLSLIFRNRFGHVLKEAALGKTSAALAALTAERFEADLIGACGALFDPSLVKQWVRALGLRVLTTHGVRVVPAPIPEDERERKEFVRLDESLGKHRAFAGVARYVHLLARPR